MIFGAPGKATNLKKTIYLIASTTLGIFLGYFAHAAIEINYINWIQGQGRIVIFYGGCVLWPWLQILLWAGGAIGGFFLGKFWWRKLYVERVWIKRNKKMPGSIFY